MKLDINCTFINHATTLIDVGGAKILTDPHFGDRVLWFKRKGERQYNPANLSPLDAILITHAHYDHMDVDSFRYIRKNVPVILPEKTSHIIENLISNPIIELAPYASHVLPCGIEIVATPQDHYGGHFDRILSRHTNAYLIRDKNRTVFFCGDSSYSSLFKEIGDGYKIDLALLPIGGYSPRWLFKRAHMTPKEAVSAFKDLKAREMIPIHWGTFTFSLEGRETPKKILNKILEKDTNLSKHIHILEPGKGIEL